MAGVALFGGPKSSGFAIGGLKAAATNEEHVRRFEIAVDDAERCALSSASQMSIAIFRASPLSRAPFAAAATGQPLGQCLRFKAFQHEEVVRS